MIIGISGMISSGKSTLSKGLHKHYKNSILLEEFEDDDEIFNKFLDWFYQGKKNIELSFQAYIIESLSSKFKKTLHEFKAMNKNLQKDHIFLDRFNLEHYIFAQISLKNKPKQYMTAFNQMFNTLVEIEENPQLAIFIDISFETFKQRIFKRNRKSEIDNYKLNEEYFKELHSIYKPYYINLMEKYNIKYKIINADSKYDQEVLKEVINIIENFQK
ncbi:deoxynucleoside kinase [Mycoplasma phocoenae]|uniref:Deoxynucleoside kinase n=1 Tax=Mycoplasma phocoenae TaxID=754517 RepID=A0A858U8Q0_9MOLU|nr:deoxynucleoside kinase [Mycoplasma phocoenae]QJG67086.1 deoxynucleoside kinase [Mycoplasma phocoenae]